MTLTYSNSNQGRAGNFAQLLPPSAVLENGWLGTFADPTDLALTPVRLLRAGFNSQGSPTVLRDALLRTARLRNPDQTTLASGNSVAFSEPVCAADSMPGATNNSAKVSPKPYCQVVGPARMVVGNSAYQEVVAFHWAARDGKPVAAMWGRLTDGTNSTPWVVVTQMTLSSYVEDARPTAVYAFPVDLSGLPDKSDYYWDFRAFPHVGVGASIRETDTTSNNLRTFSRRWVRKDVALAASPPRVFVAAAGGGNDTNAVVDSDMATARATPAATLTGALARAAATLPGGVLDWLHIHLMGSCNLGSPPSTARLQQSGAIVITRDPLVTRSAATLNFGSNVGLRLGGGGSLNPSLTYGAIHFRDMRIARSGTAQWGAGTGAPPVHLYLWGVLFDNGNVGPDVLASGQNAMSQFGVVWSGVGSSVFPFSTNSIKQMLRGVVATINSGYEGGCVIASTLTGASQPGYSDARLGAIWYNYAFPSPSATTAPINIGTASPGQTIEAVVAVQGYVEPTHTTPGTPGFRVCSDNGNGNCYHAVLHHNVALGEGVLGRFNIFYDDSGTARFYDFVSFKGNIGPQFNIKGPAFAIGQGIPDGANRQGNFALLHGQSCAGNFSKFRVNTPTTEAQIFPGKGSSIGGSLTVRNDPKFVADRGTTFDGTTYTAGAGGSDLHLQPDSPCRNILDEILIPFDFEGNPRVGVQDAGLYA